MRRFVRAPGVSLSALGDGWVAFSALSGETHLLNDESVALIDALDDRIPRTAAAISAVLAEECELPASELEATLAPSWSLLIECGLVREHRSVSSRVR